MQCDNSTLAMLNQRRRSSLKSRGEVYKSVEALNIASLGVMCQ